MTKLLKNLVRTFFDQNLNASKKFKKGICFFCKLDKILLGLLEGLAKNVSRSKSESSFIS